MFKLKGITNSCILLVVLCTTAVFAIESAQQLSIGYVYHTLNYSSSFPNYSSAYDDGISFQIGNEWCYMQKFSVGIRTEVTWFPWNGRDPWEGEASMVRPLSHYNLHINPAYRINPQLYIKISPVSNQFASFSFFHANAGLQWAHFGLVEEGLNHQESAKWSHPEYSLGLGYGVQFHVDEGLALFSTLGINYIWITGVDTDTDFRFASGILFKLI